MDVEGREEREREGGEAREVWGGKRVGRKTKAKRKNRWNKGNKNEKDVEGMEV